MTVDIIYVVTGAVSGLLVGLTGIGSGSLIAPVLVLFFHVPPVTTVATGLWFSTVIKLVAACFYSDSDQIDWKVVRRLWCGSLPVSVGIAVLISSGASISNSDPIIWSIGLIILVSALSALFAPLLYKVKPIDRQKKVRTRRISHPVIGVIAGAGLGFIVAITSVGAGTLGSVILRYLFPREMTPHRLVATDIVHAIPMTLFAALGYLFTDKLDWIILSSLLLGAIPAVIFGSLLARQFSGRLMQIVMSLVLVVTGVKMLTTVF